MRNKNWSDDERKKRLYGLASEDQRAAFARDRDRILYCSNFNRLSGITQIVKPDEGDVFHNRLTHSIKVAQIGRRLAEKIISDQPKEAAYWKIDPEVVEAACLAHDLGHPPFGHIGEIALNSFVSKGIIIDGNLTETDPDGFEGNAQTLRIISKLAVRFLNEDGLDLTRATIAACIKYPWQRDEQDPNKSKKWGVYSTESNIFKFAREKYLNGNSEFKTPEAELMDWADDMAYSVHDLEDFHRCNFIPWNIIFSSQINDQLVQSALNNWHNAPTDAETRLRAAFERLDSLIKGIMSIKSLSLYEGTRQDRQDIRSLTSTLINKSIQGIRLKDPDHTNLNERSVIINSKREDEIRLLKQITRDHIIGSPSLAAQQRGYLNILETVYREIYQCIEHNRHPNFLPKKFDHIVNPSTPDSTPRKVADIISSLSEHEIISLHSRITGIYSGSILDPIIR